MAIKHLKFYLLGFIICTWTTTSLAQDTLRAQLHSIITSTLATIGVCMTGLDDGIKSDTLSVNAARKFPMQSVYKFPLAMAVLDQVDKGKLSLTQKIHLTKRDVLPNTWSPMHDKYPDGNVDVSLSELLAFTVSSSDNNACDVLFRLLGGPAKVDAYIKSIGVSGISIAYTEEEMHKDPKAQYVNYATPSAMLHLLGIFYRGQHLSKSGNDLLWKLMVETTTGSDKLKALLPAGVTIAHKSGLSGTNDKGFLAASNDVGIINLPNGKYFAIAVFVSDTNESEAVAAGVIAKIARAAWTHYATAKPGN